MADRTVAYFVWDGMGFRRYHEREGQDGSRAHHWTEGMVAYPLPISPGGDTTITSYVVVPAAWGKLGKAENWAATG